MIGAIVGDVVGSPYEGRPHKSVDFPLLLTVQEDGFAVGNRVDTLWVKG
jgi:ADP-ribosylglycohydrolase